MTAIQQYIEHYTKSRTGHEGKASSNKFHIPVIFLETNKQKRITSIKGNLMWRRARGWAAEWMAELGSVKSGGTSRGGIERLANQGLAAQPLLVNLSVLPF